MEKLVEAGLQLTPGRFRQRTAVRVMIVGFPARKKQVYQVTLKFDSDASKLAIPPPRVQIELDSLVTEGLIVVGGILDSFASLLCLIGVLLFSLSLLS